MGTFEVEFGAGQPPKPTAPAPLPSDGPMSDPKPAPLPAIPVNAVDEMSELMINDPAEFERRLLEGDLGDGNDGT